MKINKKMLIIELNEFCPNHLEEIANRLNLKYLKKIFNLNHTKTYTNDLKEFQGLDPWVQWVSIHNGIPLKKHGVKRLGDISKIHNTQIWNNLANKKNINWVVNGVMNSKKGDSKGCILFIPDPWSSDEKAFPEEINSLLELSKYVAKNYLSLNYLKLLEKLIKAIPFFLRIKNLQLTKKLFIKILKSAFNPGLNVHTLTILFDYLLVLYFSRETAKKDIDLTIIFLNHIAHLQHHFWLEPPYIHPQMKYGAKICNEIIGILMKTLNKNDILLVLNALSQKRSDIKGIQVYRQKDPIKVLQRLNIKNMKVEQNMTNDGTLIFKKNHHLNEAFKILSSCKLSTGENLFFIEKLSDSRLFVQLNINHYVAKDTLVISDQNIFPFYELFLNLTRTGSHIPEGDIFSKNIKLPNNIENHKIYEYILKSF